jgi:hypothetical protein
VIWEHHAHIRGQELKSRWRDIYGMDLWRRKYLPAFTQGQMRHSRISTTMGIYAQIVLSAQRRALLQLSVFASGRGVPATQQIAPRDLDFSEPTDEKDPRSDSRSNQLSFR